MFDRLDSLDEKLDSLLQKFHAMKQALSASEKESEQLKNMLKLRPSAKKRSSAEKMSSGGPEGALLRVKEERDRFEDFFKKSSAENEKLVKKLSRLKIELDSKKIREKETLKKIQLIISRIDVLESEIGELENE
jgi:regulator of replication initiation timing